MKITERPRSSPRARRMRVVALSLLMTAGCVNFLDRSAVAVGNAEIRATFNLSVAEMGILLSSFAWAYGLSQIPVGLLIDKFGPRRSLTVGLCLWSIAQTAAAVVGGLGQFIAARVALGIGEAPMYLSGTKVCTAWFHARDRSWPIGLFNASSALGPALAPPLLTALMLAFGWRWMFATLGIAGGTVAIAWAVLYRDPPEAGISEEEQGWIRSEDADEEEKAPLAALRTLLRLPTSWFMAIGFFGVVYMTWLFATWLPDYLETARGLSVEQTGIWVAVPMACGFFGALSGGSVSHLLARKGVTPVASCTLPLIAAMMVTALCTLGTALAQSTTAAILLVSAALFCSNLASSCGWALASVATGAPTVATLEAIQNVGGSVGGALAPALTGFVVQLTGSFTPALLIASAISLATGFVYWFGVTRARRCWISPGSDGTGAAEMMRFGLSPWYSCNWHGFIGGEERRVKLSARNQIRGRVVAVEKGQTTGHVRVDIGNGAVITSSITNEAIDDLQLKVGDDVTAVIKASDVMVGK